jgi:hypothetical protein
MDSGDQNLKFPLRFSGTANPTNAEGTPAGSSGYVQQDPGSRHSLPPTAQTTPQGMEQGLNYSPADYFLQTFGSDDNEAAQQSHAYATNLAQGRPPVHHSTSN